MNRGAAADRNPTEWSLQRTLTKSWLEGQLVVLAGEPLFLTAWEVMGDYRINDARRHWNQPSIDFLFLDRSGHLVALELKRRVQSPRDTWSVLCQVTHRAYLLGEGYQQTRLETAYRDCWSGLDGRRIATSQVEDLHLAHARAFGQDPLDRIPGVPVRRFVMAESFGPSFAHSLSRFADADHEEVKAVLSGYSSSTEFRRFLALPRRMDVVDPASVQAIEVPVLYARDSAN